MASLDPAPALAPAPAPADGKSSSSGKRRWSKGHGRRQTFGDNLGAARTNEEFKPGSFPVVFPTGPSPPRTRIEIGVTGLPMSRLATTSFEEMMTTPAGAKWLAELNIVDAIATDDFRRHYRASAVLCAAQHIHRASKTVGETL